MPFIVRLFLQSQNQIDTKKGSECSGTIIDNHWIATSFACCEDMVAFQLVNFGQKRMHSLEQRIIGPLKIEDREYDVCLIRTNYDIIKRGKRNGLKPSKICLPDKSQEHGTACWIASWKSWGLSTTLQSIGINVFSNEYCVEHR